MDSDDNCLVIDDNYMVTDEWNEDMEVSSTTPSKIDSPVRRNSENMTTVNENEADSSMSSTLPVDGSTAVDLSPKTPIPSSKEKSKNREKRKSKDERRKSAATNSEKKKTVSKKAHSIRLTDAVFKEKILNITAQKHQLYAMHFNFRKGLLYGEMPTVYPAPPKFPDLSLTQLLNWPDIKMHINLDYLTFSREIKQNCDRDLVFGDNTVVNIDKQKNPTATRYYQMVAKSKTNPMVLKDVFDEYVTSLMEAAPHYEVGPTKLPEIEQTFQKMLDDVATVPYPSIQTRMAHSRFLNGHKYFCTFPTSESDAASSSSSSSNLKVRLREIVNPEVEFTIIKCSFTSEKVEIWQSNLAKDLENILVKRTDATKRILKERFKKCLEFECTLCNEVFEGALWAISLKDHIKTKHFVEKKWTCVKCLQQWDQFELLEMEWKHDCSTSA